MRPRLYADKVYFCPVCVATIDKTSDTNAMRKLTYKLVLLGS